MMENSNSRIAIFGFIWLFLEKSGNQIVSFFISIILARLLMPSVYGTIAIINVFIKLLNTFIDSGMATALIQKKDADELDFSTLFCFNLLFSIILYIIMFVFAPFIASFYNDILLEKYIRVLSISLILAGFGNILNSYIYRNFLFKKIFFIHMITNIISGSFCIFLAYNDWGIWALIVHILSDRALSIIATFIFLKWFPKIQFSYERLKSLFDFGSKILISKLLEKGYSQLGTLIIGKYYTKEDLAFYGKGHLFPGLIIDNATTSIDGVLFPIMSKEQNSIENIKDITRRSIMTSTYIIMPIMVGLAVIAEPLVKILLTEKWISCVFYLRIACFSYMFYPLHTANLNAIKAIGKSDVFMYLEFIKKIVGLIVMMSTIWISIKVFALSSIITGIISQIINTWPNKKLLNYSYISQIKDIGPQIFISFLMGLIIYPLSLLKINNFYIIVIMIASGCLFYITISFIFQLESFKYIWKKVQTIFDDYKIIKQ